MSVGGFSGVLREIEMAGRNLESFCNFEAYTISMKVSLTQAWFGHYLTPMIRHKPIKSSKILIACFFHSHGPVQEP